MYAPTWSCLRLYDVTTGRRVFTVITRLNRRMCTMAEFRTGWRGIIRNPKGQDLTDLTEQGPVVSASEKAANSRGLELTGRISLSQYEVLVSNGYSGDDIRRWTAHKADEEIKKRGLRVNVTRLLPPPARPNPSLVRAKPPRSISTLPNSTAFRKCPHCGVQVKRERFAKHLRKVHNPHH